MELVERLRERFLVRQFQRGNTAAFLKLVQRYEHRLLYYVRRFERDSDRALDILQDVWLAAWSTRGSLREPGAFRVWLYRIAHGQVVAVIRTELRKAAAEQARPRATTVEEEAREALEIAELVHFGLSQLTADHREILTLRFLEDMTTPDIAAVTGLALGTVKSRLHYACKALQTVLEEQTYAIGSSDSTAH